MQGHANGSDSPASERFSLIEFGALRQRVSDHDNKLDSLERGIKESINSLNTKLDGFITQYTSDQIARAGSSGYAKGERAKGSHLSTILLSVGTSGLMAAFLNKVFGLHIPP